MRLSELVGGLTDAGVEHERTGDADITDVVHRTARVTPGALYCCVPGSRVDGHDLAADAVALGAVALLVERDLPVDVAQVRVPSVRAAMGPAASRFWGDPSRSMAVVGVTGTNGKTTTVAMIAAIAAAAGRRCEVLGTLTSAGDGPPTTPDAPELQTTLARWRDHGVDIVAMEVSSHALAMGRVDGTWFAATGFTNLGRDHLELHGDMEAYFAAKASLFRPDRTGHAVIRADDPWGARLIGDLGGGTDALTVEAYVLADAGSLTTTATGTRFLLDGENVDLPMVGDHNVANALCAARISRTLGIEAAEVARGLSSLPPVRGRFETVTAGQPFTVAVDYAHTPDALATVLVAARARAVTAGGRVIVVFGCGGDRDRGKRPQMGAVAAASADVVVVTTDNPRSEAPGAIIDEIIDGIPHADRVPERLRRFDDRSEAIHHAVREAQEHDVVVIAGKGHETTQTFADRVVDFDDRAVALEALAEVVDR